MVEEEEKKKAMAIHFTLTVTADPLFLSCMLTRWVWVWCSVEAGMPSGGSLGA